MLSLRITDGILSPSKADNMPLAFYASSVAAIWLWARGDSSYTQFKSVTVSVGEFWPGTATVCASGITPTASSAVTGPIKVPCTGATGQRVQYIYLLQLANDFLSINEVLVLRDGEPLACVWLQHWQQH